MLSYRKICLLYISLCITSLIRSQVIYTPLLNSKTADEVFLSQINDRYNNDIKSLQGNNKKELGEIYKERYELIKKKFEEAEIITTQEAQSYLNAILAEILKANPSLPAKDVRVLFSRSYYANAASMGEGTIFFYIGLFHRLENESQAAFILCHELAHYFLDHSNKNINQYVNTVYSEQFQKRLKSIQKAGYGKNTQIEELTKNLMFRNRRHSREFEQAADSMAIELLKNSRFDVAEALTALNILDAADSDKYAFSLALEEKFSFPDYRFKKSWLQSDDLVFKDEKTELEKKEEDSLKTHPDCKKRIEVLEKRVKQYQKNAAKKSIVDEAKFQHLKTQFDFEIITHCFHSNKTSRALYYSLQMLKQYPGHPYLVTTVGKSLNRIYSHQKNHELNRIIDLPNPQYGEEYNQLLQLLQNLRLHEIGALAFHFLKQYDTSLSMNKEFEETFTSTKKIYNQQ